MLQKVISLIKLSKSSLKYVYAALVHSNVIYSKVDPAVYEFFHSLFGEIQLSSWSSWLP